MANATSRVSMGTTPWGDDKIERGLAATATIYYPGGFIGLDNSGNAVKCDDTAAIKFDGINAESVRVQVFSDDAAGDRKVKVERPWRFTALIASATAGDEGKKVYARFDNEVQYSTGTYSNFLGWVDQVLSSTQVLVAPPWAPPGSAQGAAGGFGDDVPLMLGDSDDLQLLWSTGDASNHAAVLALGDTNEALHITDVGAKATDWNVSADTHPTVYVHSNTTPATDYLKIGAHNGTVAWAADMVGGPTIYLGFDGLECLELAETASAVNHVKITNAATGNNVAVDPAGDDTDVGLTITAKGAGDLIFTSGDDVTIKSGTAASDIIALQVRDVDGAAYKSMVLCTSGNTPSVVLGTATADLIGFFGVAAVNQPDAYTQTYATADKTHANLTATTRLVGTLGGAADGSMETVGNTMAGDVSGAIMNNFQELFIQGNALLVDLTDLKQLVNSVIDDLQELGLVG